VARYATKIGRQITRVPKSVMQRLTAYAWPGNVRELENVIERAVILSPGPELALGPEVLAVSDSGASLGVPRQPDALQVVADVLTLGQAERNHILSALRQTQWRIDGPHGAARILDIHPNTLRSRMKKLGIHRSAAEAS
jgi:formate hydrogenlyase transcriptional activator